ncbi:tRNA (adenosine(37)-N6)-threonylcarbamoyltransferase complex dimerization subunit type 1 TsaB [Porticoccus sp.]
MLTVLALDTTTPACSVALRRAGETFFRFQLASREHTQLLLPMVDDILSEASVALADVDALVFTHGPGSFTGIRIGFGVVQGLAFGADIPVVPVSSLETLAHTAIRQLEIKDHCQIMPMFDARMEELYWARFEWRDRQLLRLHADSLSAPEQIEIPAAGLPLYGVGDGWHYSKRLGVSAAVIEPSLMPDARDALSVAMPAIGRGQLQRIEEVQPLYLRDKVSWKKRQRLRPDSTNRTTGAV